MILERVRIYLKFYVVLEFHSYSEWYLSSQLEEKTPLIVRIDYSNDL